MASVRRFEDLHVWQRAREMDQVIFRLSGRGLFGKDYELRGQIRKSSGSIMDNIAEGFERGGRVEFIQFLAISKGSAGEVRSQCYRAFDREYISRDEFENIYSRATEISKMLQGLIRYLRNSDIKGIKYREDIPPTEE